MNYDMLKELLDAIHSLECQIKESSDNIVKAIEGLAKEVHDRPLERI
jgi:hypothetical protein